MKKITLYSAFLLTLFACKKEKVAVVLQPSVTLIAPNGGETYHARDYITVTWKSSNLPVGSVILASLGNTGTVASQGVYIYPQTQSPVLLFGNTVPTTANDGSEVFEVPYDTSLLYHGNGFNYGNTFKIRLIVVYQSNGVWTTIDPSIGTFETSSNAFFSVYNCGCTSLAGYSSTTGQPCSN